MHPVAAIVSAAAISLTGFAPAHTAPATAHGREAVYGGFTSQGWPVVVEVSPNRRAVDQAAVGGDLKCTGGGYLSELDPYTRIPLGRHGAFRAVFSDYLVRYSDGSFDVFSGALIGKANAAHTKMTGTWRMHDEAHDASGAVTDQCDSGLVHWTARR